MNKFLAGSLAGFAATAPMTVAMEMMHRRLPEEERYPLPPYEITTEVAEEAGINQHLDESQRLGSTLVAHFAYGTTVGGVYAPLAKRAPGHPILKGVAFGLLVWAASYLGLLPALGILRPATEHPARRNALMIAAHIVWGAVLGSLVDRLDE